MSECGRFDTNMRGCCPAVIVSASQSGQIQMGITNNCHHTMFGKFTRAQVEASGSAFESFQQLYQARRNEIVAKFAQLKAAVDADENAALTEFDASVASMSKRFQAQLNAFKVKVFQAVACCNAGLVLDFDGDTDTMGASRPEDLLPVFNDAGMQLVKIPLEGHNLWSFANTTDRLYGQRYQLLDELHTFLACAKENAAQDFFRNPPKQTGICHAEFKGHCLTTRPFQQLSISAIAVSRDGSLIAVLDHVCQRIGLISTFSGESIARFGFAGKCYGLCFSSDDRSMCVAEMTNRRIQEVTLKGDHIRFVGVNQNKRFYSVDASADVIVSSSIEEQCVLIFDTRSGELTSEFEVDGCQFVKLSQDGTSIAITQPSFYRISIFTFGGACLKFFNFHSCSFHCPAFLGTGQLVVAVRKYSSHHTDIRVYSDGKAYTRVFTSTYQATSGWPAVFTTATNDFMYFFDANKMHVLL